VDFAFAAGLWTLRSSSRTRTTKYLLSVWSYVSLLYVVYCVIEILLLPPQPDTCVDLAGALLFHFVISQQRFCMKCTPPLKVAKTNSHSVSGCICSFCTLIFGSCFALTAITGLVFIATVQRNIVGQVHYYCQGKVNEGTIIFIHPGSGAPAAVYSHLPPILSQSTRTCSIQTPGIGWSSESDSTSAEDSERLSGVVRAEFEKADIPIDERVAFFAGHSRGMMITYYFTNFRNNTNLLLFNQTFVVGIDGAPRYAWEPNTPGSGMFKDTMANFALGASLVRGFAVNFLPGPFRSKNPFDAGGDLGWHELMMVLDGFLRPNFMRTGVRQGKESQDARNFPQDGPPRVEVFTNRTWIDELRQNLKDGTCFDIPVNPDARVQWNIITDKIDDAGGLNVTHTGIVTYERNAVIVADWLLILLRSFRDMGYYYYPTYMF